MDRLFSLGGQLNSAKTGDLASFFGVGAWVPHCYPSPTSFKPGCEEWRECLYYVHLVITVLENSGRTPYGRKNKANIGNRAASHWASHPWSVRVKF
jgi:hypothetical protein